jgi:hypothetical protein
VETPGQVNARNTTYKVVLPFYIYASISFLAATLLLFLSAPALTGHYFQPKVLAITHTMALGWGTMIIFGASHQLLPVLTESRLYSVVLGYFTFGLAAVGIPMLVYGFYNFNMGWPARCGGSAMVLSIVFYVINLAGTISKGKKDNIHALFSLTASLWLVLVASVGLMLVFNFTTPFLPAGALSYLPLHAHIGIAGWFLLLVIGVGSRLLPMFLISKYDNKSLLWLIYILINGGLLSFLIQFCFSVKTIFYWIPVVAVAAALVLFGYYCYQCHRQRIRKRVDGQMRISLLSTGIMLGALLLLVVIVRLLNAGQAGSRLVLLYGFGTFFGWITAIILGMTFKTLPFIMWNKIFHLKAGLGKTPSPHDLMSNEIFKAMIVAWIAGVLILVAGICSGSTLLLRSGSAALVLAALLYSLNVVKIITYKPSA